MKHLMVLILSVCTLFTFGCKNSTETLNVAEQQSKLSGIGESNKTVNNSSEQKSGKIDTSLYYFREYNPEKELNENKITWKEGDITFIAEKSESQGEEKYESDTVISSITIKKGNKEYAISLDRRPIYISSLGLSASGAYLALEASYLEANKVIIVNLASGEYFVLNDYLESNGLGFVESIDSYSWSPDGNKLAFSFGRIAQCRPAIYNLDNKTLSLIPTETDYIATVLILWHKDGKGLDFISELPPSHLTLYRYYFDRDYVENIMDIERDDLLKLSDFRRPTQLFKINHCPTIVTK